MNRFEKTVLGITGGSHLSVHALMLALPSLIPILRQEFSIGLDTLGLVATISAFMFGIGAIPSGLAESRRSEERRVGKECRSRWSPYH